MSNPAERQPGQGIPLLGPRLAAVQEAVLPAGRIADIGTDHGLLAAALARAGRRVIASEKSEGPYRQAQERLSQRSGVELRCGDGLTVLEPGEAEILVLAGMGGALMLRLLTVSLPVVRAARQVVLQPQKGIPAVRAGLVGLGLRLTGERLVRERDRWYAILAAEPAHRPLTLSRQERETGVFLPRDPLFPGYRQEHLAQIDQEIRLARRNGERERVERLEDLRTLWQQAGGRTEGCG